MGAAVIRTPYSWINDFTALQCVILFLLWLQAELVSNSEVLASPAFKRHVLARTVPFLLVLLAPLSPPPLPPPPAITRGRLQCRLPTGYPAQFFTHACPLAHRAATTTQRMMDNGIGMDMVSLSQPPLHTAPLFISKRLVPVDAAPANPLEAASAAAAKAKQHEQQQQQQHVPQQGADSPVSARRDPSLNSEEAFIQEHPKYEVGRPAVQCVLLVALDCCAIDCSICAWWKLRKWTIETRNPPPDCIVVVELNPR